MNLDDFAKLNQIDSMNMISEINALPDQIAIAIDTAKKCSLPAWTGVEKYPIRSYQSPELLRRSPL